MVESSDKKIYKTVTICGKNVTAIIDSGSDLHLVRASLYKQLNAPKLSPVSIPFDGVGSEDNRTIGRFEADIIIDELPLSLTFDVISNDLMSHDLIIGGELSDHVEIKLKNGEMTLSKIGKEEDVSEAANNDPNWKEVMNIREEEERGVLADHIADPKLRAEVRRLVQDYQPAKTKSTGVKMHIVLKDDVPVHQILFIVPRRLSAEQRNVVNEIINEWIEDGIVRPSTSEYVSPIVLVAKKDGRSRLCVDYRMLNQKIIRDRFPLPLIEDQLDRLQDATVFSALDLRNGFFHVPMEEKSVKYT